MNKQMIETGIGIAAAALMAAAFLFRFTYASPFAATWDQVDFALALDRYDIALMQPHFPGYPFFILGGMIVHIFVDDPAKALSMFNAAAAVSAAVPMYLLARRYVNVSNALLVVAVLQTGSYYSILTSQPMSEGAALAVLWWFIWSVYRAYEREEWQFQLLPPVFFALLMGIRLSYAPFGLGLLALWLYDRKRNQARVPILVGCAVLFQCIWVGALAWSEGGIVSFLKLSLSFVDGHFTEWGGAVTETSEPLWSRVVRFVVTNVCTVGLFSRSIFPFAICTAMILLLVLRRKHMQWTMERYRLLLLLTGVYAVWNVLAQNIDKPRHSYPVVMLLVFLATLFLVRQGTLFRSFVLFYAASQLIISIPLLREQASHPPATYQLASYLSNQPQPLIVYTWEETRVLQYLDVPYDHTRFYQYDYFLHDKKYHEDDTIYVTNHLLDGFRKQGISVNAHIEKVTEFHSNPLFDPVYSEIVLYKWKRVP